MAAPTSTNEVTARRLASVITNLWNKAKSTFYKKPSNGIPKTDLDSDVQSILDKVVEIDYGSTEYTVNQIQSMFNAGKTIVCNAKDDSGNVVNKLYCSGIYLGAGKILTAVFSTDIMSSTDTVGFYIANYTGTWNYVTYYPASLSHKHSASDINSGTLPDARIASADTWNGKMDNDGGNASSDAIGNQVVKATHYASIPTGKDVQFGVALRDATAGITESARFGLSALETRLQSDIESWGKAEEVFDESDGGRLLFLNVPNGSVIRIKNPSSRNSGLASLLVQATANGGWPLVFQVGWRMSSDGSYSDSPKVAFLYSTSHSSDNKMATVKTGSGDRYIYIAINRTDNTTRRVMLSLHADYVQNFEIDFVSATTGAYKNATKVSDIEGCVMKENIGTAIGGTFQPVFINEAGFANACLFKLSINVLSTEQNTISFV